MLKLMKAHHYSKKEKSTSKRNKFISSFRVGDKKTWEWLKKRQTKEGDGGYDYCSARPSIKS